MKHILIVDDDITIRKTLCAALSSEPDWKISSASNGAEALALIKTDKPDLVVTDIIMPDEDGIYLLGKLHKEFPEIKSIAMSGGGRIKPEEYLYMADGFGAVKTFSKPFRILELIAAVKEIFAANP